MQINDRGLHNSALCRIYLLLITFIFLLNILFLNEKNMIISMTAIKIKICAMYLEQDHPIFLAFIFSLGANDFQRE